MTWSHSNLTNFQIWYLSLLSQIAAQGALSTSSQSTPPAELSESFCSVAPVDHQSENFQQETELRLTDTLDKNTEEHLSQSKTIVNDSCLMELFKKCQTCGHPITKKKVSVSLWVTEEGNMELSWRTLGHMDVITLPLGGFSRNPPSYSSFHSFFWRHFYTL